MERLRSYLGRFHRRTYYARSKACCEKSAEVEVRNHEMIGGGLNFAVCK